MTRAAARGTEPLRVKCPSCAAPCLYAPTNPWRPFCSERCRSVDLGAWANERYRVGAQPGDSGSDPDGDGAPP